MNELKKIRYPRAKDPDHFISGLDSILWFISWYAIDGSSGFVCYSVLFLKYLILELVIELDKLNLTAYTVNASYKYKAYCCMKDCRENRTLIRTDCLTVTGPTGGSAKMAHYSDVIMGAMSSQISSLTIVYSTVYSGADHRKHQSSASWPLCGEFTGDRWIPRTKGQ